jgi:hypothetical protein
MRVFAADQSKETESNKLPTLWRVGGAIAKE